MGLLAPSLMGVDFGADTVINRISIVFQSDDQVQNVKKITLGLFQKINYNYLSKIISNLLRYHQHLV